MTVKICSSEYLLATVQGLGLARSWFPRIVAEAFLQSTKDGDVTIAPDPVTMIDGDLAWFNNTGAAQVVTVQLIRAPRSIETQSPCTVVIHDAHSFAVGLDPAADFPSVIQDTMGGKVQLDRPSAAPADLLYGRFFFNSDSSQEFIPIGTLEAGESMHFRYIASVQTPGTFIKATEFEPEWQAEALWARLLAFATPRGSA